MKQKIFTNCFLVKNGTGGKPSEVCLAMKKRGFGVGMWNGSGGKPNEGESVEGAAKREVWEEFGIRVLKMDKRAEIDFVLKAEEKIVKMHTFVATEWEGEPTESEEMKPQWFEVESVPYCQMWKSDAEWLPEILAGKTIKAAYTYDHEGGEVVDRRREEVEGFTL